MMNPAYHFARMRDLLDEYEPSRERSLAQTKLDECELWLTRCTATEEARNRDLVAPAPELREIGTLVDGGTLASVTPDAPAELLRPLPPAPVRRSFWHCTVNRPHRADECNGEHLDASDAGLDTTVDPDGR